MAWIRNGGKITNVALSSNVRSTSKPRQYQQTYDTSKRTHYRGRAALLGPRTALGISVGFSPVVATNTGYENPFRVSGNSRTLFPVAANTALQSAGTNGGTPGSPTPAGGAVLSTI